MLTIRRIQFGEGELYKDLRLKALKDSPEAFCTTLEEARSRSPESWQVQADGSAAGQERATFLAFSGEDAVGLAACYRDEGQDGTAEILQVWIAPECRGTGLAAQLMDTVVAWAREQGYTMLKATVREGNARAMCFYVRYGFRGDGDMGTGPERMCDLMMPTGAIGNAASLLD